MLRCNISLEGGTSQEVPHNGHSLKPKDAEPKTAAEYWTHARHPTWPRSINALYYYTIRPYHVALN